MRGSGQIALATVALAGLLFLAAATGASGAPSAQPLLGKSPYASYLPLVARAPTPTPTPVCPPTSSNQYGHSYAYQVELGGSVLPAFNHPDKNLALRGYLARTDNGFTRGLVDYGRDDTKAMPPQFATIFRPYRVPSFANFYQVHDWDWAGFKPGALLTSWPVTALGMRTTAGEPLYVPASGYKLDQYNNQEVLVLFADEDSITLKYTRADGYAPPGQFGYNGYTVHIDKICTDPNLLAGYRALDDYPNGPRYTYVKPENRPYTYNLPVLSETQSFGRARGTEVVIAIVDSGNFMDPRSAGEWWIQR